MKIIKLLKPQAMRLLLLLFCAAPVFAQADFYGIDFFTPPLLSPLVAGAPEITSQAAVLIDAETGTVLYAKNPDMEIPPASLAKLMTIHLVMKEVNAGRASLDDLVPITEQSWALRQPPRSSLMFLAPGQIVTLREIILGLAIPSGNDAAVAAALQVAPTVDDFAVMMTAEARRMGMTKTRFVEPSGISENNMTTAADFAAFCRMYLRLYPQALSDFHSVPEFAYPKAHNVTEAYRNDPRTITQANRNGLLKTFPGVDGLKTGYIDEAGYNIALTASSPTEASSPGDGVPYGDSTRFIAVILGAPARPGGDRIRDRDGESLLSWAFENFKTVRTHIPLPEPVRLWKGKSKWVDLQIEDTPVLSSPAALSSEFSFTAPADRPAYNSGTAAMRFTAEIIEPLIAPLPASFPVGWLVVSDDAGELHRVRLITRQAYQEGNIFKRIWDSIRLFFLKK